MSKRVTGLAFIAISAFLLASLYVAAAILTVGTESYFRRLPTDEFGGLIIASAIALAIGIFYFVWGELRGEK